MNAAKFAQYFVIVLGAVISIVIMMLYIFSPESEREIFVLICTLPTLVLLELYFKYQDLFSPIVFFLLTTLFGVTLKSIFAIFFLDDTLAFILLQGKEITYFYYPTILLLCGFLCFSIGFRVKRKPLKLNYLFTSDDKLRWSYSRILIASFILLVIAVTGFLLFIKSIGSIDLDITSLMSKKYVEDEDTGNKLSFGYFHWMSSMISYAYYIVLVYYLHYYKKIKYRFAWRNYILFLFLLALIFPLFINSRSEFLYIFINTSIILYRYDKVNIFKLAIGFSFALSFFMIMTIQRSVTRTNNLDNLSQQMEIGVALQGILGRRSLLGVFKTAHIINGIPDKLEYRYGATMTGWVTAGIPRTMWKNKPIIANGAIIGEKIFGTPTSGVPSGLFGELYWNFGILGILIGGYLYGIFLKTFYVTFKSKANPNAIIIYSTLILFFSFFLVNVNINQSIVKTTTLLIPLLTVIIFISKKIKPNTA